MKKRYSLINFDSCRDKTLQNLEFRVWDNTGAV